MIFNTSFQYFFYYISFVFFIGLISVKDKNDNANPQKNKQIVEETIHCPTCGGMHLTKDYSRAELGCDSCGLVIDAEIIDHRPEWRALYRFQWQLPGYNFTFRNAERFLLWTGSKRVRCCDRVVYSKPAE